MSKIYYSRQTRGFYATDMHGTRTLTIVDPEWEHPTVEVPDPEWERPLIHIPDPTWEPVEGEEAPLLDVPGRNRCCAADYGSRYVDRSQDH